MKLKILYVRKRSAAVSINSNVYYIKVGPDLFELYDSDYKQIIIPNLDAWIQAQTRQECTLYSFKQMMAIYESCLKQSYNSQDINTIANTVFDLTIKNIFQNGKANKFLDSYWIESLNHDKFIEVVKKMHDNFDVYLDKLGKAEFSNYLCRMLRYANINSIDEAPVIEKMFERLGVQPKDPTFKELDISKEIRGIIKDKLEHLPRCKGIDHDIIKRVDDLENSRPPARSVWPRNESDL